MAQKAGATRSQILFTQQLGMQCCARVICSSGPTAAQAPWPASTCVLVANALTA